MGVFRGHARMVMFVLHILVVTRPRRLHLPHEMIRPPMLHDPAKYLVTSPPQHTRTRTIIHFNYTIIRLNSQLCIEQSHPLLESRLLYIFALVGSWEITQLHQSECFE